MVDHAVLLRRPDPAAARPGPIILQRTDQNFLPSLLEELKGPGWLATIRRQVAASRTADGVLSLFQPVHRTFHLVLLEVVCDTAGSPRLDPGRIESAGLVLRRLAVDSHGTLRSNALEGWMQDAGAAGNGAKRPRAVRGWLELSGGDLDGDPDPARRPPSLRSGHPDIDRRLALAHPLGESLAESVSPLFVAPPEVCTALGKTILYGLVPVTSSELSEAPAVFPPFEAVELRSHLPALLRQVPSPAVPRLGGELRYSDAVAAERDGTPQDLLAFIGQLRQLDVEFGAFSDGPAAQALYRELNTLELAFPGDRHRPAGEFLKEAVRVLVTADDLAAQPPPVVRMPSAWPSIDAARAERIVQATRAALTEHLQRVIAREGRFAQSSRRYCVRAFVRVKSGNGCHPNIVWSSHSDPFVIAPWYAPSEAPPVQVALPDPSDRHFLRNLKPNVAFALPKPLFNLMRCSDPKKLMTGEGTMACGGGVDLDWICTFNIPIITLCAFIVLNIFLQLFNLIFSWLPFVKICIPIPRRGP